MRRQERRTQNLGKEPQDRGWGGGLERGAEHLRAKNGKRTVERVSEMLKIEGQYEITEGDSVGRQRSEGDIEGQGWDSGGKGLCGKIREEMTRERTGNPEWIGNPRMEPWRDRVSRRWGRRTPKASDLTYFLRWTCTALNTSSRFSTTKSPSRMRWSPGCGGRGPGCSSEPSMTLSRSPSSAASLQFPALCPWPWPVTASSLTSHKPRLKALRPAPPPRAARRFRFLVRTSGQLPGASRLPSGRSS